MRLTTRHSRGIGRAVAAAAALLLSLCQSGGASAQSVGGTLDDLIEDRVQRRVEARVLERLARQLESSLDAALESASGIGGVLDGVTEILPDPDRPFRSDVDPAGRRIERDVLVVLTSPAHAAAIGEQGFEVRELRRLESLGRVLIRVGIRADDDLAAAAAALATQAPEARVDFNHLYDTVLGPASDEREGTAGGYSRRVRVPVGMVDSAVAEHDAFRRARIERRDFVPYDRPRPTDHGTAVASILVADTDRLRGALPGARLFAASVFFETEEGAEAATTASLVEALDWLAGGGVRVVNMSLTGPPNAVLEDALERLTAMGIVVVAAVGNNGPIGKPRHPAAYDTVLGITAVGADLQIYRYAARGPQVAFSSRGVDVEVARGEGGYGRESGTSMAAPLAAAVIAHRLTQTDAPHRVLPDLRAMARDLGDAGFDETFGHGLLAPPD